MAILYRTMDVVFTIDWGWGYYITAICRAMGEILRLYCTASLKNSGGFCALYHSIKVGTGGGVVHPYLLKSIDLETIDTPL
jgi:hypothetical protein